MTVRRPGRYFFQALETGMDVSTAFVMAVALVGKNGALDMVFQGGEGGGADPDRLVDTLGDEEGSGAGIDARG